MKIKEFVLSPFNHLRCPDLDTPLSTIPMPPVFVCMALICISFFVIIGGFIYCIIRNVDFMSAKRLANGQIVPVIIAGGYTQTGAECFIVGGLFTVGGIALTAGFMFLYNRNRTKQNKNEEEQLDLRSVLALTSLLWVFIVYLIFTSKMNMNVLRFTSR